MKKLAACAALALCLLPAAAFSKGNCFRFATQAELAAGFPTLLQVDYCNEKYDEACYHKAGPINSRRLIGVSVCTKDDIFDYEF